MNARSEFFVSYNLVYHMSPSRARVYVGTANLWVLGGSLVTLRLVAERRIFLLHFFCVATLHTHGAARGFCEEDFRKVAATYMII